ncbi:enoyl-CoA hydratase/isomerase family protein, partial [Escherichia coli]|uniref:enoyl-CoA hydratase/isomerase family protein n=1 Tax=Escherichia coli TaxID=562 RepID=UPI0013D47546
NGMVRGVLAHYSIPRAPAPIEANKALIDSAMAYDSAADIISAFERDASEFAQATVKLLRTKSPTSLKVTLRLLREAKASTSLRQCLTREY